MTKKKKKLKKVRMGQKPSAAELKHQIFKFLKSNPKKRLTAKQIIKKLNLANSPDAVNDAMQKLAKDGKLYEIEPGRFRLDRFAGSSSGKIKSRRKLHVGKADLTRSGAAYVVVDGLEDDVYVAQRHTNGAMQGDKVQVSVHLPRGRRKPEGEIVKVVSRATEHFLGVIRIYENYALLTPSMYQYEDLEIQVGLDDLKGAKDEDVVVVKITK